jgi:site-specific DNA-methyltransferase (adenine-specific)
MKPYYEQDRITIYHGDCRALLGSLEKVDLLMTDPPYGIDFAGQPTKWQRRAGQVAEAWDESPAPAWLLDGFRALAKYQVIWGGNYFPLPPTRCWLIWHKPDAPPSMADVDVAWTNFDKPSQHMTHSISATNAERVGHPTQKPEPLIRWAMAFAPNVSTVLDPFMGSGTTLVAAKRLGRQAVGIERDERYCEAAAERLAQGALPLTETA